jgi:hypothetical protein
MPLVRQLDYHILALRQEPPDDRLAAVIASQGDKIIAPAIDRMKSAEDDGEKHHIIALFEAYCRIQGCSKRADLFEEIQKAVDSMRDESWKRMSQRSLDFMKEKSMS